MKKNKSQKAFTLIELLVVMAIIAILSAIMFGPIQTARRRSKDTQAVADMKLIANYLELYAQDNGGVYPASPANAKTALQAYGNVPIRFNNTNTPDKTKYNYVSIYNNTSATTTGYQIWTQLNDANSAFDNDADCSSTDLNTSTSCWGTSGNILASGTGTGQKSGVDGVPSASVCTGTDVCTLDYANGK